MLILFLTVVFVFVFVNSISNTIFDINAKISNVTGLLFAKEIFLFVLIGVFLFEFKGLEAFATFYMTEKTMQQTSLIIFYALILLFASIGVFSKTIFRKNLHLSSPIKKTEYALYRSLTSSLYVFHIILILIFILFFGLKHSFVASIFGGGSLIDIRLGNRYSGIPTIFISLYGFLNVIFCCVVGFYFNKFALYSRFFLVLMVIVFVSFFGGKAPVVNAIILFILSYLSSLERIQLNIKTIITLVVSVVAVLSILYFVISLQFEDFAEGDFFNFIVNRIGVGQIHGAYEQFSLQLRDSSYILHTIPFANFFYDYTPYNKDLMMHTWGYNLSSQSETGVMNSLFIGEALAIGGYILVAFSPIIVAFNFCLIVYFLVGYLKKFFHIPLLESQKIAALSVVSFIGFTADITGLLLFKSLVMVMIFMSLVYIFFVVIRSVKYKL